MEDTLTRRLDQKLEDIERRLKQLELGRVVLDEKKVLARERELEGKTYFQSENGGIVKEVRVPVCDLCGRKSESFNACVGCGKKLCNSCGILFENKIYCADCLNEILPLTKQEYKVLVAIVNDLKSLDGIAVAAKIKKDLIMECEKNLEKKGLIRSKGFVFFKEIEVSDKGLEAIATYRQLFGTQEDVAIFEKELRRLLSEKS
jgi:hypothetical protein